MSKLGLLVNLLFAKAGEQEFAAMENRINAFLYDLYKGHRNRDGKVTAEIMSTTKKCFDFAALNLVKAHRNYVANENILDTLISVNKAYEALAEKFSRSVGDLDISERVEPVAKPTVDSCLSVIVTTSGDAQLDEIKKDIYRVFEV